MVQCLVDDDQPAQEAVRKAIDNELLDIVNVNHCSVPHLEETELEYLYDKKVYEPSFNEKFRVLSARSICGIVFKNYFSDPDNFFGRIFKRRFLLLDRPAEFDHGHWARPSFVAELVLRLHGQKTRGFLKVTMLRTSTLFWTR